MKHRLTGIVIAGILVLFFHFSHAAQKSPNENDFSLLLQPVETSIQQGNTPKFRLKLTNMSKRASKILNVERRVDLQHAYYKLTIKKNNQPVDVPVAISDPGPISDADWIEVPPGGTRTFLFSIFPEQYQKLSPGLYKAYVSFWRDPYKSHLTAYKSPPAEFIVTK